MISKAAVQKTFDGLHPSSHVGQTTTAATNVQAKRLYYIEEQIRGDEIVGEL